MVLAIKSFVNKLRNDSRVKRILFLLVILFFFLYVFSIPSFSGRAKWNIISYILMALLFLFTVIYSILYTKFSFNRRLLIPASFVLIAFIGTLINSHSFVGKNGAIGWVSLVLMFITFVVFYYSFLSIDRPKLIIKLVVGAFLAFAVYFAFIYRDDIIHFRFNSSRLGGYFDGINVIGFYFSLAFIFSLYLVVFFKKKRDFFYLVAAMFFAFLGLFTGSRAFLICSFIGVLIVLILKLRHRLFLLIAIIATLVALIVILINIPQLAYLKEQLDRALFTLFGVGGSKVDTSTIQRVLWPKYAFYLAGKNMIFGLGVGGFGEFSGIGTYAHNNFAEVMCNFGLTGFVLYYFSFAYPVLLSFVGAKDKRIVIIIFVLYIARSLFGVTYYSKESYLFLALCFYLVKDSSLKNLSLRKRNKNILKEYYETAI